MHANDIVAIAVSDPELLKSLSKALCSMLPADRVKPFQKDDPSWQATPRAMGWLFFDATLLLEEKTKPEDWVKRFRQFTHIVVFCTTKAKKLVDLVTQPIPGTSFERLPYLLPSDQLLEIYGSQLRENLPARQEKVNRQASTEKTNYIPIYDIQHVSGQELTTFLNYLQAHIQESNEQLKSNFVSESSNVPVPVWQRISDGTPLLLHEAEENLRSFVRDTHSAGLGVLLVGKSGAGKSTLTHFVGQTEDEIRTLSFVSIDYTFIEGREILYGNLLPLSKMFVQIYGRERFSTTVRDYPHTVLTELPKKVQEARRNQEFPNEDNLSEEILIILNAEGDRSFISRMYCYFEEGGKRPDEVAVTYSDQSALLSNAERWYMALKQSPGKLFLYYLDYVLSVESVESFEIFSYFKIVQSILISPREQTKLIKAIQTASFDSGLNLADWGDLASRPPRDLLPFVRNLTLPELRPFAVSLLRAVSENTPLLFLFDNIDQRPSPVLEAKVIWNAIGFFRDELLPIFQNARALIAMRDTTYQTERWVRLATDQWPLIEVSPPDLKTVLQKRVETWERRGVNVGKGDAYRFVVTITDWIRQMRPHSGRSDSTSGEQHLIDIIEARHPFNVGEQLRTFGSCCRNALLHKAAMRDNRGDATWSDRSFEFFLRVFLLGERRFFREDTNEIPNIFDNGEPESPWNACLRAEVLLVAPPEKQFQKREFLATLVSAGLPEKECGKIMDVFQKYSIFRTSADGSEIGLSVWGKYFKEKIAFDLPYISTIWWTTPTLPGFSLKHPFVPKASELEGLAGIFQRWIQFEEDTLFRPLFDAENKSFPKIFPRLSFNLLSSLRRIEQALR